MSPAVTFHDVTAALGGNRVLDGVSFSMPRRGNTVILGPNGAGKTTLLLALLGMTPYSGAISFADGTMPRVGYVPQKLNLDAGIPVTVMEFVCLNWRRLPLWFGVGKTNRERALKLLDLVGAAGLARRRLGALSGGELRRVLLASALGRRPELLVLDEPTSGIDFNSEDMFHKLLDQLRRELGFTQVMVCHNLSLVRGYATKVVCLNRKIVAEGEPEDMLAPSVLARMFIGAAVNDFGPVFARVSPVMPTEAFHA
jgi:zinc transport system ATP-binding protein